MKNDRGFSLVELIVVIAIMAVLVGVLAPSLLRYVEKSRYNRDIAAISEVVHACELAMVDDPLHVVVGESGQKITLAPADTTVLATSGAGKELEAAVSGIIGSVKLTSKTISSNVEVLTQILGNGDITITVSGAGITAEDIRSLSINQ